ncbi:imelysin family protein [Pseudoalteromonas spongiae]|uniref:imelysin family protein n=1 Tax=Pseudoalteromonas spongiae TaxID=298657 RepID=UPI000C2D28C9|nr:imelysin family protein [Pseudoalteromonas spongiae]
MKLKALSLLVTAALLSACGGGSDTNSEKPPITPPVVKLTKDEAMTKLLAAQADNYILPAYQTLMDEADKLDAASIMFCAYQAPSESELIELKNAWLALSKAWQFVKAVKMGPESEEFRHYRLQFWPDNNNAVQRGVASLLAAQVIDENAVASLQDGAQGLPALELLIFNQAQDASLLSASNKQDRCLAVMAIAANVKTVATEILALWQHEKIGFVLVFKNGTGEYNTKQAVLEDFITNWFELIEVIKDNKLNNVKGTLIPGYPEKAESYISLSSLENIKTNFAGLKQAYLAGNGYGFDEYLVDIHENTQVNDTILNYFDEIDVLLNDIEKPLSQAVTIQDSRNKLSPLITKIDELRTYLSTDFIQLTGLNPNFNSNDGD